MNPKTDKTIRIVLGVVFLFTMAAYLIFDWEWAKLPFYLFMVVAALYNLSFFSPGSGKE